MAGRVVLAVSIIVSVLCSSVFCRAGGDRRAEYSADLDLVQVQIAFRHGDRTPLYRFPGKWVDPDAWNCDSFENIEIPTLSESSDTLQSQYVRRYIDGLNVLKGTCTSGQLTSIGAQQHLNIGVQLRQKYIDELGFMPATLESEPTTSGLMFVRSTDVYRTRQSVEAQLLGMYPTSTRKFSSPIEVHTVDANAEYMFPNGGLCPKLAQLLKNATETPEYQAWEVKMSPVLEQLEQVFGATADQMPPWSGLYDALITTLAHNHTMPPGLTSELQQQIFDAADYVMQASFAGQLTARLGMGRVVGDILDSMLFFVNKTSKAPERGIQPAPWMAWSGHDTTLGPLAIALGVWDGVWPPYATHLIFELLQSKSTHKFYVHATYNNVDVVFPTCQGQAVCPFEQFEQLAVPLVPTDYAAECAVPSPKNKQHVREFKRLMKTVFA
eukprot:ANDGO_03731.mRNA.1 Counting factor 60